MSTQASRHEDKPSRMRPRPGRMRPGPGRMRPSALLLLPAAGRVRPVSGAVAQGHGTHAASTTQKMNGLRGFLCQLHSLLWLRHGCGDNMQQDLGENTHGYMHLDLRSP